MQNDGNFVLYNGSDPTHLSSPYWASNTNQSLPTQYVAIMQDDADFVVYQGTPSAPATPLWATNPAANSLNLLGTNGVARTGSGGVIPPPPAPEPGQTVQTLTSSSGDP